MPTIHLLPDILASQVAAGEVVERPASVVKELVENSIDAGAREIRVAVDKGGSALIRVSDDGSGMTREDALLSLERHATSKLRNAGDLAAIRTLGFRGEAVPSIASVSRFRMVTRRAEAIAGTEIVVEGGKLRDVREAGCAPGTVIEARALFFNIPARRKFLRAESTEAAHVEHQLRLHALAAPQVRFVLRRDEREVFDLPAVAKPLDRVRQMLGTELARELIPLPPGRRDGVAVEGFVLPARHARKGLRHQYVFLNGRPVEDGIISRALGDGFRGAVADGLQPAAWLWITMNPALVDVNVHPAKREVRFHQPQAVRDVITEAVLAALKPPARTPSAAPPPVPPPFRHLSKAGAPAAAVSPLPSWLTPAQAPLPLEKEKKPWQQVEQQSAPPAGSGKAGDAAEQVAQAAVAAAEGRAAAFRLIGTVAQRWFVMETAEGLVLFDPTAATERILYERLLGQRGDGPAVQQLLVPVLLEMDPRDHDLLLREKTALAAGGVELDGFGGNTVQIRALPACLKVEDPRAFLSALLDELLHENPPGPRFAYERVARTLARKAAAPVMARLPEAHALLVRLFACELPYCAPDGRPTLSEIGHREIEKRFQAGKS